ncbi:MAG: YiiD C-terminal domain-containing protein [Deltaproteobacteria bacterium]|nr:YiiD C-terminal domain-containing protein [Deltaproteobacteria bacterium]
MTLPANVIKELIEKKIVFLERMKLKALELRPGYVKLLAPLAGNENHIGGVYAGAMFTLAEIPGGALFYTSFDETRFYPLIKEMAIQFLKPATTDVLVEASLSKEEIRRVRSEMDEKGKSEFILSGEVKDMSGRVVARSRGVYQIRSLTNR